MVRRRHGAGRHRASTIITAPAHITQAPARRRGNCGSRKNALPRRTLKTDDNWNGQYSYLGVPVPTKRLPITNLDPSVKTIEFTDTLKADLERIADFIKRKQYTVEIQAYTDNTGTEKDAVKRAAANKALSQQRADAIVTFLTKQLGADAKYLKAIGYGEEFPIADNTTDQGRKINRRVVVKVTR